MKFAAFAVLLVVVGACAATQSEVEPTQSRIWDLWVKSKIERFVEWILEKGWEPLVVEERDFKFVLISRNAEARASIRNLVIAGASNIVIEKMTYNFGLGRLDFNVVHRGLRVDLGKANVELIYGNYRGEGEASGSGEIRDIRLKGNVLLKHDATGRPWIYNINVELDVGGIEADWKIVGGRDYSETVNRFLNVRLQELLAQYKNEINTVVGELIKKAVELYQSRN